MVIVSEFNIMDEYLIDIWRIHNIRGVEGWIKIQKRLKYIL